jgi:hypothetical protein
MTIKIKLIILSVLAAITGVIALILGQKAGMGKLSLALSESYHTTAITDAKAKADALMKTADADEGQVKALQDEIDARKSKLTETYVNAGMSNDEVAAKLASLKV